MTEAEMRAVAKRLEQIVSLRRALATAEIELKAINTLAPTAEWRIHLTLKERSSQWTSDEIQMYVTINRAVAQQQAVDRVARIRREIVAPGGEIGQ